MRRLLVLPLLFALTACSDLIGAGQQCTLIGTRVGIRLDIDPAYASRVDSGSLTACWADVCRTRELTFMPSATTVDQGCTGDTCSARSVPTGGKNAFADLPDLPVGPVSVTVKLGAVEQKLATATEQTYPNGPECGEGGPALRLKVDAGGRLTA